MEPIKLGEVLQSRPTSASNTQTTAKPQESENSNHSTCNPLPQISPPANFHDLDPQKVPDNFKQALNAAANLRKWPVYAFGSYGQGKSYAAAWAFQRACQMGFNAEWHPASELIRFWVDRGGFGDGDQERVYRGAKCSRGSVVSRIGGCHFLILDDIGIRNQTEAQKEALWEILEARKDKPTIYTSNLSPQEAQQVLDGRLVSRLLAGTWVKFTGPDRRLEKPLIF